MNEGTSANDTRTQVEARTVPDRAGHMVTIVAFHGIRVEVAGTHAQILQG